MPGRAREEGGRSQRVRRWLGWLAVSGALAAGAVALWPDSAPTASEALVPRRGTSHPVERTGSRAEPRTGEHLTARTAPVRAIERPGAKVRGTVRWEHGAPVVGAEVALIDAEGEPFSESRTDSEGGYALEDEELVGAEIVVTDPAGLTQQHDLSPLSPGEERTFDVVLGEQREVVGWVLDNLGDPQPGVVVSLGWEAAPVRWHAVTDAGGGFTFVDVPVTPLRVTADGGELGMASARVARTEATRREVTLVLEPVGTIVVRAGPELAALGEVVVRCFAASAHGEDGLWNDDLRDAPEVGGYDDAPVELAEVEPAVSEASAEPGLEEIEAMLGNALRGWDQDDPEGSLVQMALSLASASPMMAEEMKREMAGELPELAGAPLEEIARAAAQKMLREEPKVAEMMGLAAIKLQEGARPMDAFAAAEQELREPPEATAELPPEAPPDEAAAIDEAMPIEEHGEGPMYPGVEGQDEHNAYAARLEELREKTGADFVTGPEEARSLVASGRVFDPIPVRGAFEYVVAIRAPDGFEVSCGTVFVPPGEEVVLGCGRDAGPAVLAGRVIDTAGEPIAGAVVEVYTEDQLSTTTDHAGRYELTVPIGSARTLSVAAMDPVDRSWTAERRQQNARPGVRTEVPDIVARRPEERPVHAMTEPFGGIGANIDLGSEGIVIAGLFEDGPLAMSGVEEGDVIIRIGEEIGASLSIDDALAMLRGEVGTELDLTLRSSAGEVYDLMVTRGLVDPGRRAEFDYE